MCKHTDLVPDTTIAKEFNRSLSSLGRWSKDVELDFPKAVKIRGRNFRSRSAIEAFRARLIDGALKGKAA